ncbi:MAG TPA: PAS domain-containing protein [Alphaproteobacteria bacterium]|nr:PAS domain-containing protein [Alphaproteobacteria bacterium]
MGFVLMKEHRLDCATESLPLALGILHTEWQQKRRGRAMPPPSDIDPSELHYNLVGRVHLLEVEGPSRFRYRLYGRKMANPGASDMTGLTTLDYTDMVFGTLVTRHLSECVRGRSPICYEIRGVLDGEPYEYTRLALPLSSDGDRVDMILVASMRGTVPEKAKR